ncbi:hypothetical protein [Wenzhouxiangella sp. XN24]|uniref:hypothetical protein n=1 Tax=Wenzhouxiangella sp. XN24 TaxID=2713569 RepID=UPI0013ED964F|nr:hypothetical protein [Wenzhouxiangella sp. XN24]NGX17514.1 hypothetical protein [Wenzhouxiangella sp. XN24]
MDIRVKIIAALLATLASSQVLACGDSLYRVGQGVSYRVYTAPLPGNVLVYGHSEGAQELAEALAMAGHGVRLVDNQLELSAVLAGGGYDVVIAPYRDHEAVEVSKASSKVDFLPVAVNASEREIASQSYAKVMVADRDEIKHYLRAIHESLRRSEI